MFYSFCFKNSFVFPSLNPPSRTPLRPLHQIIHVSDHFVLKDLFSTQKLKIMDQSPDVETTPFNLSISFRSSMLSACEKDDVFSPIRNDCMMRCHRGSNVFEGLLFSFKFLARIRRIPEALQSRTSDGSYLLIRRISLQKLELSGPRLMSWSQKPPDSKVIRGNNSSVEGHQSDPSVS